MATIVAMLIITPCSLIKFDLQPDCQIAYSREESSRASYPVHNLTLKSDITIAYYYCSMSPIADYKYISQFPQNTKNHLKTNKQNI